MRKGQRLELVGAIAVDAGMVMVGDPCYHLHADEDRPSKPEFGTDWSDFCKLLGDKDAAVIGQTEGTGCAEAIVVSGFGGDGIFPVYVRRDAEGDMLELVVDFRR